MKKYLTLLFVAAGLLLTASAYSQSPQLSGKWTLESAVINKQENGRHGQVHALTGAELEAKQIPAVFEFGNSLVTVTVGEKTEQSDYSFDRGQLTYGSPDKRSTATAWLDGETSLVVVSEYTQSDFPGNELRLIYKKNN
jgi:hypothetical protein